MCESERHSNTQPFDFLNRKQNFAKQRTLTNGTGHLDTEITEPCSGLLHTIKDPFTTKNYLNRAVKIKKENESLQVTAFQ